MSKKILLCAPRGFCAGVERAILIVELALRQFGAPVYVRHEIVHNKHVVERLKQAGAVFIEELAELPDSTRPLVLSAHGSSKALATAAQHASAIVMDAVCPLVTKVHNEAIKLVASGHHVLLVGHKNHIEVVGTMGQVPAESITLIETEGEAESFMPPAGVDKLGLVTQTTLSVFETQKIIGVLQHRFSTLHVPKKEDICYATTNRQLAVRQIAAECDLFIIIGSKTSSNTARLTEAALQFGARAAVQVDEISQVPTGLIENADIIGISSGASAPEILVTAAVQHLTSTYGAAVETVMAIDENVTFGGLPASLREIAANSNIAEIMQPYSALV